jgi:hypothetical protein
LNFLPGAVILGISTAAGMGLGGCDCSGGAVTPAAKIKRYVLFVRNNAR